MGNDLLNFISEQGLPWWIVFVIGGGTIVAAVISFIGAFAIAWVNARAAVRLELEKALRDHRRINVDAVRDYVKRTGALGRGRIELSRTEGSAQLVERSFPLLKALDDSAKELGALHVDGPEVRRAVDLYFKSGRLLGLAVASVEPGENDPFTRIDPYFELIMNVAGAAMDAADAYVFPIRQQKRLAKQRLDACVDLFGRLKAKTPGAAGHPELA